MCHSGFRISRSSPPLDGAGRDFARADGLDADGLGAVAVDLGSDAFEVQDDFGDILTHALDGGELMHAHRRS